MAREHVAQADLVRFAQEKVNLSQEKALQYREQVNGLRDKLEKYLADHPNFSLKKMMLSGSLAKGTALRTLNDIDVACYISGADAPKERKELLEFLAARLRTAYPNFSPEQVKPQTYSVTVSFQGSGLDVDIVPILYDGDPKWYGNLLNKDDGSLLMTNIPLHLEFIRKRKAKHETHFAQVTRLVKFWIKKTKAEREGFRFKSFMAELILAHLSDKGVDFSDYAEAMQEFFTYIAKTDLNSTIVFFDYYYPDAVPRFTDRVQIVDPINPKNNAAKLYTIEHARAITETALDAGDAIDAALAATTKQETVRYWQKVFGPTFQA